MAHFNRQFILQMKCCLFRVGAGHCVGRRMVGGTDGRREGEREGRVNGWITQLVDAQTGGVCGWQQWEKGDTRVGCKDLLWRLGVNHLSGTRHFYGSTCSTLAPLGEGQDVPKHTHAEINLHVSYNAKLGTGRLEKQKTHPLHITVRRSCWMWWWCEVCICCWFIQGCTHTDDSAEASLEMDA